MCLTSLLPRTVLGFRANTSVPHKEFEYQLPLRSDKEARWLRVRDEFAYVDYKTLGGVEMDVIELGERSMSRFNVSPLFVTWSNGRFIG